MLVERHRNFLAMRVISVAALLVLGTACGGSDDGGDDAAGGDGGGGTTLSLTAEDNEFSPAELSVTAGEEVTVEFENAGDNPHTFTVTDLDVDTDVIDPGGTSTVTFTAPDSSVDFVCKLHESDGMVGEIVVE